MLHVGIVTWFVWGQLLWASTAIHFMTPISNDDGCSHNYDQCADLVPATLSLLAFTSCFSPAWFHSTPSPSLLLAIVGLLGIEASN
jgi:hypothetical protein